MKILVTGAAGFIGSYVSRALLWRGDDVVGIDNFNFYYPRTCKEFNLDLIRLAVNKKPQTHKTEELQPIYTKLYEYNKIPAAAKSGNFDFYEGDITDYSFLEKLYTDEKIDAVIHLAAMAGVPYSLKNPRMYVDVNVSGTTNLLDLSVKNSIKNFVFASSSSVYGSRTEVPFRETDLVNKPISTYAASKVADELVAYSFYHNHKLPIMALRFFTVYGPLQRPYAMVVQRFINLAHNNKPLTVFGDGSMGRDYTFIYDIVDGILGALDHPQGYEVLNLGNSSPVTLLELIKEIEKSLSKPVKVEHVDRPSTEVDITYADTSKAKRLIGYEPKTSISEGLAKQVEVFKLMPNWYQTMENV